MIKEKRMLNVPVLMLSAIGIITIVLAISFVYFSLNGPDYTENYNQKITEGEIKNPITEFALALSDEIPEGENVIEIDTEDGKKYIIVQSENIGNFSASNIKRELINYVSIVSKIYNLHNIPFTTITPKIQIDINKILYSIEISDGKIFITDGSVNKPDVIIKTTNEEIFKMIDNKDYARESIISGKTNVELIANKFVLFSKGYLTLYNDLTE